jgi:Amt family ammonium transporter
MFNQASIAWMLFSAALVMFMTPGLAFFYGGLVGKKNVVAIMTQSFISLGITIIMWYSIGFSLSFSGSGPIIGNLNNAFLKGITLQTAFTGNNQISLLVFFIYQAMFAVITPALITGGFANRMSFKAYIWFLILWQLFIYYPFAHMIWGNGILYQWGVLDFAGGIVVHALAGFSALATVFYIGKRKVIDNKEPSNLAYVALGTAMLWFGWYGFNAGSALQVNSITVIAFINTTLGAAFAATTWMIFDVMINEKPKLVGFLTGAVVGLATITPAAGYVSPGAAAIIGIVAAIVCYSAISFINKKNLDDTLAVWGVHGIGGVTGTLMLGLFASKSINPQGVNGLLYGNAGFFIKELVAVAIATVYAFIVTYLLLMIINIFAKVRVSEEFEKVGLDESIHGEKAFNSFE